MCLTQHRVSGSLPTVVVWQSLAATLQAKRVEIAGVTPQPRTGTAMLNDDKGGPVIVMTAMAARERKAHHIGVYSMSIEVQKRRFAVNSGVGM